MGVAKSFVYETDVPDYQREAVEWLENYRNTSALQDLLRRCRFSKEEVEKYRRTWVMWLKPKQKGRKGTWNAFH